METENGKSTDQVSLSVIDLRIELDGLEKKSRCFSRDAKVSLVQFDGVQNAHKVFEYVQLGRMWLGKVIQYRGTRAYPYPESSNPENMTIESPVDTVDPQSRFLNFDDSWNHVQKAKGLRQHLGKHISTLQDLQKDGSSSREESIAWTNAFVYLSNAKMYLGLYLGRILEGTTENFPE